MVTKQRLVELYVYKDGNLLRINGRGGAKKGTAIGNRDGRYIRARTDGKKYLLHRLIWVYHYGDIEEQHTIDHIDGDCFNNKIENLRKCCHTSNMRNTKRNKRNTSGQMGVSWYPKYGKWLVRIGIGNKKRKTLGYYDNYEEAVAVRKQAEEEYTYHSNHGRVV